MANKSLLTYGSKVFSVEQMYFSPTATLPPAYDTLTSMYCFLSKVDTWSDDNNPDNPQQSQSYLKQVQKNIFVVKHIRSADISPVIKRIDWTTGTVYDYYQDDIDMLEKDTVGDPKYQFYVRNKYDQVFKCLWNNNGLPSAVEPYFQPGAYGTNNIFKSYDGYKWKYMYTINSGQKLKFMDLSWMPVSADISSINPLVTSAGYGNIDVINVIGGGTGYDPSNTIITTTITGDGQGAAAYPVANNGIITDFVVSSTGSNYTFADISVTSSTGSNVQVANIAISPIGGHGHDPITELGCDHVMITTEFNSSESGLIPTDITYHQIGILTNPVTLASTPSIANGEIYKTTTDVVVASGFGAYISNELVYQGGSVLLGELNLTYEQLIADPTITFVGRILSFDPASNVIKLINTKGTPTLNAPIFGQSTKTTRTVLSYSTPTFVTLSGYVYFVENRSGIQRSSDGIEQFKLVIGY